MGMIAVGGDSTLPRISTVEGSRVRRLTRSGSRIVLGNPVEHRFRIGGYISLRGEAGNRRRLQAQRLRLRARWAAAVPDGGSGGPQTGDGAAHPGRMDRRRCRGGKLSDEARGWR